MTTTEQNGTQSPNYALTEEQKAHFLKHGFVRIPNCFSPEKAAEWTDNVWVRLGYSRTDKSTWAKERINMPHHRREPARTFALKAWAAICELCGGEDRISDEFLDWRDSLIVNLGTEEWEGRAPHPRDLDNWHVDGDFFVHYLDSPEQALLVIPLFSDIKQRGGGTMICPEGIPFIARHLVSRHVVFSWVGGLINYFLTMLSMITPKAYSPRWPPGANSPSIQTYMDFTTRLSHSVASSMK